MSLHLLLRSHTAATVCVRRALAHTLAHMLGKMQSLLRTCPAVRQGHHIRHTLALIGVLRRQQQYTPRSIDPDAALASHSRRPAACQPCPAPSDSAAAVHAADGAKQQDKGDAGDEDEEEEPARRVAF